MQRHPGRNAAALMGVPRPPRLPRVPVVHTWARQIRALGSTVGALLALLLAAPRCTSALDKTNCDSLFKTRCIEDRVEICNTDGGDPPWRWELVTACAAGTCRGGVPMGEPAHCATKIGSDPRCPSAGAVPGDACFGDRIVRCYDGFVTQDDDCAAATPPLRSGAPHTEATLHTCVLKNGEAECAVDVTAPE